MRFAALIFVILTSCYSFKGTSIDPEVKYFAITKVEDVSSAAPANYAIDFGLSLSNKIRRESRLILDNKKPDVEFECKVVAYSISAVAPVAGQTNALNRLTINMEVIFRDLHNEKNNWQKQFSKFEDFRSDQSFTEVQSLVTNNINKLLLEDIFNASFSNW